MRRADPLPKRSYRLCIRLGNWKSGQGPTKGCRAIDDDEWWLKMWAWWMRNENSISFNFIYIRHNWKFAGSSPNEVELFSLPNPSSRTMATLPSFMSRVSRKCGSLDVSQPHGPSRPVTGVALPFFFTDGGGGGSSSSSRLWLGTDTIKQLSSNRKMNRGSSEARLYRLL
jgi:hypothetical protein